LGMSLPGSVFLCYRAHTLAPINKLQRRCDMVHRKALQFHTFETQWRRRRMNSCVLIFTLLITTSASRKALEDTMFCSRLDTPWIQWSKECLKTKKLRIAIILDTNRTYICTTHA
jgi:hypothetical protein